MAVKITDEKKGPSGLPSQKISDALFKEWLKITCDINAPKDKVSTPAGDLILDPDLRGTLYLKGLKLDRSAIGDTPFHYGYNLHSGEIGRDRSMLRKSKQDARIVQSIWAGAIKRSINESDVIMENDLRGRLFDIFQNNEEAPDIAMADKFMEHRTAMSLWKYMSLRARENKVFYIKKGDKYASHVVKRDLGCQPEELAEKLWNILRTNDSTCWMPQEERDYRFKNCQQFSVEGGTWFAHHAWHAFSALVKSGHGQFRFNTEEDTQIEIDVKAVHGKDRNMRCLYRPSTRILLVNGDKFQDFNEAHGVHKSCASFSNKKLKGGGIFRCNHHVTEWFVDALAAISDSLKEPLD